MYKNKIVRNGRTRAKNYLFWSRDRDGKILRKKKLEIRVFYQTGRYVCNNLTESGAALKSRTFGGGNFRTVSCLFFGSGTVIEHRIRLIHNIRLFYEKSKRN